MRRLAQKRVLALVIVGQAMLVGACSGVPSSHNNPFHRGGIYQLEGVTKADNIRTLSGGELHYN